VEVGMATFDGFPENPEYFVMSCDQAVLLLALNLNLNLNLNPSHNLSHNPSATTTTT
jgi:hypothetical protein